MINKLIKEVPRATIIAISIFFVLLLIRFITGHTIHFNRDLLTNFGYVMLYGFTLYFANALLFIYLDKVFQAERFTRKRIIIGFVSSFLVSILVIFLLRVFEDVIIEQRSFSEFLSNETMSNYLVSIIITLIVSLAFHAFYFYKAYNESKVKEQKIIASSASAQFESLKNQIDPHFLFNSLNVLSSLIEENPEAAQKFTTSLSKVYRYVLEQKDKELVSVEEELKFAKTYMNLLKMRFENSITFEVPEFENDEAKVVPLSLQLLLENCIKHNIVSEKKPLHIKIYIEENELIIENNKQIKEVLQDRKGVGLQNIVSRYAILTKRNVIIQESEVIFKVKLPILTKQIISIDTKVIESENMSYVRAKERVEKLKGFYGNLISYCCVIPLLMFINIRTSDFQWFWFPMLGWGFGLTIHAAETFGYGKAWEEKKIREILNKDKDSNKNWK
ncbi:Pr2TM family membrane protein [Flavobacterium sp. F372]|uniref:Histidine kinase n=1 Tax=Flavobacterium bernardetii TaxID=2813823 RepID=A0ABR7IV01_9FLAO|nr:2TM domain-containing protein [Flavobacterium bernardetii]MBC5833553.1 histidine kinase [Flavobacterium bernardetii]NHF68785.1 Pr2TM family membrane protein [Flavobacterium bernardetii]